MNKSHTFISDEETPDFLVPHVESKLKAENVPEGAHDTAINVLGRCVAGAALIRAYKRMHNITETETGARPMKINVSNEEKITKIIDKLRTAGNGHKLKNSHDYQDITKVIHYAERNLKHLPKTHRKGVKLIDDLQPLVPNSYGYSSAKYTQITLERGSSAWFLVDYKIIDGYVKSKPYGGGYANDTLIVLNHEQKQTLVSNFLSDINVRVSG